MSNFFFLVSTNGSATPGVYSFLTVFVLWLPVYLFSGYLCIFSLASDKFYPDFQTQIQIPIFHPANPSDEAITFSLLRQPLDLGQGSTLVS